jgi:hypothetical protein
VIADHELDKGEAEAIYEECKSLSALVERLSKGNNASQSVQNLAVVTRRTKKVAHTLKRLIGVSLRAAILQPGLPDVFPSSLPAGRLTMDLTTYYESQVFLFAASSGTCVECGNRVDTRGEWFREEERLWHVECLMCDRCCNPVAFFDEEISKSLAILLRSCRFCGNQRRAHFVTSWSQSGHLLWVGLARLSKSLQMHPRSLITGEH